ncbi:galactokinase [Aldersonia sp. NBC_00410]|uniref:galactokinase n=1 Tax=Aldersonia sp. NBC_00410 TaxID=2975954 RepID=UPI00225588DF|nr:galactokinase [Aldersonia sp. NBC_00410]MCX5044622.1 galactokinase [Aldersonia sp. NBC_00410]
MNTGAEPAERPTSALESYREVYGTAPDGSWAAPGRVNIIGEHTDYNNGYVLPIALPHVATCAVGVTDADVVRVASLQKPGEVVSVELARLADNDVAGWARYLLGVVHEYRQRGHPIGGLDLLLDGAVPVGAGLSSSAAIECSIAVAARDLFGLKVSDDDLISIAVAAENDYVGAPTGRLDQSASMLCTAGCALFLDVGTGERAQVPFDLAAAGLALLVIDTNTPHRLVAGEYAQRRKQCEQAAAALGVASLREIADVAALEPLDGVLLQRARHVVSENARVLEVVDLLRSDQDPRTIGPNLTASHASLRDDFAVSTIQLDTAVETALEAGAFGARMVGGGFGGSAIALVDTDRTHATVDAVLRRFAAADFIAPRTFVAIPSAGARRLT